MIKIGMVIVAVVIILPSEVVEPCADQNIYVREFFTHCQGCSWVIWGGKVRVVRSGMGRVLRSGK